MTTGLSVRKVKLELPMMANTGPTKVVVDGVDLTSNTSSVILKAGNNGFTNLVIETRAEVIADIDTAVFYDILDTTEPEESPLPDLVKKALKKCLPDLDPSAYDSDPEASKQFSNVFTGLLLDHYGVKQ